MSDAVKTEPVKKTIQTIPEDLRKQVDKVNARAAAHGVILKPGEPIIVVMEKLLDRMDGYRDQPLNKGRILIE